MDKSAAYKLKIVLVYAGVTVGVCLAIKFILPLATPFVIALLVAVAIDRPVTFLTKKIHLKRNISSALVIVLFFAVIGAALFFGGRALIRQINSFAANFDSYFKSFSKFVEGCCGNIDSCFHLGSGTSYKFVNEQLTRTVDSIAQKAGPVIMNGSKSFMAWFTLFFTAFTFCIMATAFFSRDMEKMRYTVRESVFRQELAFVTGHLKNILGTYLRTQLLIMLLTCIICFAGLYLLGNRYALLLGVLIGIIDAFPVLGTGTVFLPWTLVLLVMGRFKTAAAIFAIYLICYYTRAFLEPRLMGNKLEISPIIMLVSLYAGLLLFGISGVITGPIAALLIKEIAAVLVKNIG
ncbi:MAG: sporulation integral membrane protein YtvI [Butyrivibrio sp.]|nr:sporulation integral membrane protein YtvI [Butyrivibrio sp.]